MSRRLRSYLLGCIGVAFLYLLWHSREPLRFNVGDPWSDANVLSSIKYVKQYGFLETSFTDILDVGPLTVDSYRYIHYPPFSEIIYGAIGKYLGASDIATFRLFALAFSGLAMGLLFQYARRMYNDRVALVATMLFATSLFWMMYADSMHQAPVMQASGFLALWGLVRAIETRRRRHYAAAVLGAFACFFTSYDYWLFLPAAMVFTIYVKLGNPFARGQRRLVALCAAGCVLGIVAKCLAVIGAVGWTAFVADLRLQFLERSTSDYDRGFTSGVPTMIRRITMVFTPLAWITFVVHTWRALRAPTLVSAIKDTAAWMLVVALVFFYIFAQLVASQMLPSQVLLPFYTIGSALLIERLLDGNRRRRLLGFAWIAFAPLWSFAIMLSHPRSLLDRDDVAKVNAYFADHDRNDFVLSNLMSLGHVQVAFERHYWTTPAAKDTSGSHLELLSTLDMTGTDYVHALVFTTPESRFIDKSLWGLAMPRHLWSVTGWPHLYRAKTNHLIEELDQAVQRNLVALEAKPVLHFGNFDVYRMDRATVMDIAARRVPVANRVELGSLSAVRHELLGWSAPHVLEPEGVAVSTISGYDVCGAPPDPQRTNACKTVLTSLGLEVKDARTVPRAQLLVRVERACELRIRVELGRPSWIGLSMNGFAAPEQLPARTPTFTVPARAVHTGINMITLEHRFGPMGSTEVVSLDLQPACR